jgi:hypothetical protein
MSSIIDNIKGEVYASFNNINRRPNFITRRCIAKLAAQPKLGLLPKWWFRFGSAGYSYPHAHRQIIKTQFKKGTI